MFRLLLTSILLAVPPHGAAGHAGRLVVVIVVDQLRYLDALEVARADPNGFAGLGRAIPMRYRTVGTETAVDHATLATGAYAMVHGIIANDVFEEGKRRPIVDDPGCAVWGGKEGRSATRLLAPTFGDALKLATAGSARVISISGKDRAALMLAGRSADLALWLEPGADGFVSSNCYASAPPAWLAEVNRVRSIDEWAHWVWTPSRPLDFLASFGVRKGQLAQSHEIGELRGRDTLSEVVRASPPGVTMTLGTAQAAIDALQLGQLEQPDLLLISLSSLDYVGHRYGTLSWERADQLLRIHDELRKFIASVDERVGRDRVSVLLASDHGVSVVPEEATALKVWAGRIRDAEVRDTVNAALTQAYPRIQVKQWVADFDAPLLRLVHADGADAADVARIAARAAANITGVAEAEAFPEVLREPDTSPIRRAFFPGRSGDVVIVPRPGWVFTGAGVSVTTHRSPWSDDAVVPFMLRDARFHVRPELQAGFEVTRFASSAAAILGIGPPGAALEDSAIVESP